MNAQHKSLLAIGSFQIALLMPLPSLPSIAPALAWPVTAAQESRVQYLAFPQSYGSIERLLGPPHYRHGTRLWWQLEDGWYLRGERNWNGSIVRIAWEQPGL